MWYKRSTELRFYRDHAVRTAYLGSIFIPFTGMLHQYTILQALRSGSSTPLLVETADGQKYIVKLCAGLSGSTAILSEWLASHIGAAIGLPVQAPLLIRIDEQTPIEHLYIEYRELIQKSFGLNLAYPFYEDAAAYDPRDPRFAPHPAFDALFVYDVFLLNIDRSAQNPNLLCAGDRFISHDYESSFLLYGIIEGRDFSSSENVLRRLRANPLFRPAISSETVHTVFSRLQGLDIPALVGSTPPEWLALPGPDAASVKDRLVQGLGAAILQEEQCRQRLGRIAEIVPETDVEQRLRIAKNRERFEKKR